MGHRFGVIPLLSMAMLVACAEFAYTQCQLQELSASDAEEGDGFGHSADMDGDVAVIGAIGDVLPHHARADKAYIYRRTGAEWNEEAALQGDDSLISSNEFGWSVAVEDDVVVVGCPFELSTDLLLGACYIYRYDGEGWVREAKLVTEKTDAQVDPNKNFGFSVALNGGVLAVGAPAFSGSESDESFVHLYRYSDGEWQLEQALTVEDDEEQGGLGFGSDVALCDDVLFVSRAREFNDSFGAVYVYRFDGSKWGFEEKILDSADTDIPSFGSALACDGDRVVISESLTTLNAEVWRGVGHIYRFNGESWVKEDTVSPAATNAKDHFALSCAISGETILFGAPKANSTAELGGLAIRFVFDGEEWVEESDIAGDGDKVFNGAFGFAVALDGAHSIVGAIHYDNGGDFAGSAFAHYWGDEDCDDNNRVDLCQIALDPELDDTPQNGVPDECEEMLLRGDENGDGAIGVADVLGLCGYLYVDGQSNCIEAMDVNDDDRVQLGDAVALLGYLFYGGTSPGAPFPECGLEPQFIGDVLPCEATGCSLD